MKKANFIATLVLLVLLVSCGPKKLDITFQETTSAGSKYVLSNGLTILAKENPATGMVAIDVFIKAGVGSEGEEHGLASFTNRLLLTGTEKRSRAQIIEELESVGGMIEPLGWVEYDEIRIEVPSESLSTALDIFQDILLNPIFPPEEAEKERELVISEINSKEDNPQVVADELLFRTLYMKHYYQHPQSGYVETVEKIPREKVIEFYNNWYVPNNIIIVIAGNFNKEKVVNAFRILFTEFEPKTVPEFLKIIEPAITEPRENTINKPDADSFFLNIGYHTTNSTDKNFAELKVANAVLGLGPSSRLYYEVRELRGLVYRVDAVQPTTRNKGFIKISMITRADALNTAREITFAELEKLKTELVPEQELNEVKEKMKGYFLQDHQRSMEHANYLGFYEVQGKGYAYDTEYIEDIDSVTAEGVQMVAQEYLTVPAIALVGPFEEAQIIR